MTSFSLRLCDICDSLNSSLNLHSKADLCKMQNQLRSSTYCFRPMVRYWIPKKKGGLRPITQPHPCDVLLLKGLLQLLVEACDGKFHSSSHGFRPNRGCSSFFKALGSWSSLVMLQRSDVVSCFDKIPKDLLLVELKSFLGAESSDIIHLISEFLQTPILDKKGNNYATSNKGIPQGSPISPILMNIYLHSLDVRMAHFVKAGELFYLRYADDILIGFPNRESIASLTQAFNSALLNIDLEVKSKKIWRQESGRSPELLVLGLSFSISSVGQISTRFPFNRCSKKLPLTRIEEKMGNESKTLCPFFLLFISLMRKELDYLSAFPCSQRKKEIGSYLNRLLRRRSLEFLRRWNPSDKIQYKELILRYEKELESLIESLPQFRNSE